MAEPTYLVAFGVTGSAQRWVLASRAHPGDDLTWCDLALPGNPALLDQAKVAAEAVVGPSVWLDQETTPGSILAPTAMGIPVEP
jgi:hypothetical protein